MVAHDATTLNDSSSDPITALALVKDKFSGTSSWNNPLAWRQATLEAGMPGLDLPLRVGGRNWIARQMIDVFAACGKISLDLRDVPGGGHSRLLLGARERKHDAILRTVGEAKEFIALAVTEEGPVRISMLSGQLLNQYLVDTLFLGESSM